MSGLSSKYVSADAKDLNSPRSNKVADELSISSSKVTAGLVPEGEILKLSNLKSFTLAELKAATRNFHADSALGSVFKGWIDEHSLSAAKPGTGIVVAVKRLNQGGFQDHKDLLAQVNCLSQLSHSRLVKLIGYCHEDENQLLVYEFMPRGSLENHLLMSESFLAHHFHIVELENCAEH